MARVWSEVRAEAVTRPCQIPSEGPPTGDDA